MPPFYGKRPEVDVPANSDKIVPYRITADHSSLSFKLLAAFKRNTQDIIAEAKTKGRWFKRDFKGQDVGVGVYIYYHSDGVVYYYENRSSSYVLSEKVSFALQGATIEGGCGSQVNVSIRPGDHKVVNIVKSKGAPFFSARLNSCNFDVKPMY